MMGVHNVDLGEVIEGRALRSSRSPFRHLQRERGTGAKPERSETTPPLLRLTANGTLHRLSRPEVVVTATGLSGLANGIINKAAATAGTETLEKVAVGPPCGRGRLRH
jgi:hypothetical protein